MKLLANENIPLKSILYLRDNGFDVSYVGEDHPSISDHEVIQIAVKEERTIITFDRDYGELIFRNNYQPPGGVIYLRIENYKPEEPGIIIKGLLSNSALDFNNALTVVYRNGIRQRKY